MARQGRPPSSRKTAAQLRVQSLKQERRHAFWRIVRVTGIVVGGLLVFGVGTGVGYATSLLKGLPPITPTQFTNLSEASVVYDRTGKVIGRFSKDGDRQPITSIHDVSPNLVNSFVAAEDKTFFHNIGVNPLAMMRAVSQDLLGHRIESGASTITQQTVKLALFPAQQRTLKRKIEEIGLALELNHMLSKDEIMTDYMNWVYMGRMGSETVYGVKAASQIMFDKDPSRLNLPEAAFLAAIPNNAYMFSPYQFFKHTVDRQHYILQQMLQNGMISHSAYESAMKFHIAKDLHKPQNHFQKYPYLMLDNIEPLVDQNLVASGLYDTVQAADAALPTAGYRIYTSIDLSMQANVDSVLANQQLFAGTDMPVPGMQKQTDQYQAGVTLIDNQTGGILAIGGGRDFSKDEYDHSDLPRQPGSSIKPLAVYGPAIDTEKFTAGSIIMDQPLKLAGYKKPPQNDDNTWHGLITLRQALTSSFNIPAMRVLQTITPELGTSYLGKMGITTHSRTIFGKPTLDETDTHQLATAIGGIKNGLTVQQMTSAYTVFPNQGVWRQSYLVGKIADNTGNTIYQAQPQVNQVFSPQTAYIMTSILHDVVYNDAPWPWTGTAVAIGKHFPGSYISGKTGTTDSLRDGWFVGFTQKYTMGIWMGYNHHQVIPGSIYGLKFQLWNDIMTPILAKNPAKKPFPMPSDVVQAGICKKSGLLPTNLCKADRDVYKEYFIRGTDPTTQCNVHVQLEYVIIHGKKYLATTNTPPSEVQTGIFLSLSQRPSAKTYDSWEYAPTALDPRGGTVLQGPMPGQPLNGLKAPQHVVATVGAGGVQLSWSGAPGAAAYTVWRAAAIGGPYTSLAGPFSNTSYLDSNLPQGTNTLYYEIYAVSDRGTVSLPSQPVVVDFGNTNYGALPGVGGAANNLGGITNAINGTSNLHWPGPLN